MLTRKRKRSQTSPAPEDDSDTDGGSNSEQHPTVDGLQQKESEIWEALKEEHHEGADFSANPNHRFSTSFNSHRGTLIEFTSPVYPLAGT